MACSDLLVTIEINGAFLTYENTLSPAGTLNGASYYIIPPNVRLSAPQLYIAYNGNNKWVVTSDALIGSPGAVVESVASWSGQCPPFPEDNIVWDYDTVGEPGKYRVISAEIFVEPPICVDTINGVSLSTLLTSFKDCLASKSTDFLTKIRGAVQCNHLELVKLNLIIDLLEQKDSESGLECVFNGKPFPGIQYCDYTPELNSNTYLETFIDFATRFCTDCIVTSTPGAPAPTPTITYLEGEAGGAITLENGNNIEL